MRLVRRNAPYASCCDKNCLRPGGFYPFFRFRLARQIYLIVIDGHHFAVDPRELPKNGATNHPMMSGYPDAPALKRVLPVASGWRTSPSGHHLQIEPVCAAERFMPGLPFH